MIYKVLNPENHLQFFDMFKKYGLKAAKGAIKELGVEERDDQVLLIKILCLLQNIHLVGM